MKSARLRLLSNHVRPDDYLVVSGNERVGHIYKREPGVRSQEWLWAIHRARYAEWLDCRLAGRTASLEQATSELTKNWKKVEAVELGKGR
jgi:hypothetical protein